MTSRLSIYGKDDNRKTFYSVSEYSVEEENEHYRTSSNNDEKRLTQVRTVSTSQFHKSISHHDHRHHKFYKPTSNRGWVLTLFLLVLGTCILLLELAIATHPDSRTIPNLSDTSDHDKRGVELVQQSLDSATSAARLSSAPLPTADTAANGTTETTNLVAKGRTYNARQEDLPTSTESQVTSSIQETLPVTTTATTSQIVNENTENGTSQPFQGDQISLTLPGEPNRADQITVTTATSEPDRPSQVTTASPTTTNGQPKQPDETPSTTTGGQATGQSKNGEQSNPPSSDKAAATTPTILQPPPSSQLSITPSSSYETASSLTSSGGDVKPPKTSTDLSTSGNLLSTQHDVTAASIVSESLLASGTSILATVRPTYASDLSVSVAAGVATLTNTKGRATGTVSYTGTVVLTGAEGKATKTINYGASSATATKNTSVASDIAKQSGKESLADRAGEFKQTHYFIAMYLPTVIGVILQSTWLIVFATFKVMDPFYQMASPGGASAQASLTAQYFSSGLSASFSKACLDGHWVLLLAGLIQFGLAIIMLLVSETMNVVPTAYCQTTISNHQPCSPVWVVNVPATRLVEVSLVTCFSMVLAIIILNRNRVSGVYSDPSKIATMADILVHKPLIDELRDLPANASKEQIEFDLKGSRYMLGTFIDQGREQYGIIKLDSDEVSLQKDSWYKCIGRRLGSIFEYTLGSITATLPFLPDFICMAMCFILFVMILVYRSMAQDDSSGFNAWMSSGKFGPNLLLNLCAVTITFLIKKKERESRLSHPYVLLSKGPRPASETITSGTRATQFTAAFHGVRNGNLTLGTLAVAAIFTDIVLILLPGIPFSASQTTGVYLASTYICLIILLVVFAVHVRVTWKAWRRGQLECPDTLAGGLMRLCASKFVQDKNQEHELTKELGIERRLTAEFGDDDERKQSMRYEGEADERRYIFGCMEGVDGVQRYMVEEVHY